MTLSKEELDELNEILDARSGQGRTRRPKLRLITPPSPSLLDHIAREAHLKRIFHLKRAYRLDWLVDQATFSVASVSCLEDCDLIRLLNDLERARECILEGVSFEDVGLVRSLRSDVEEHDTQSELSWSKQLLADAETTEMCVDEKQARVEPSRLFIEKPF